MLAKNKIVGFVPIKNAKRARTFYEKALGLKFVSDDGFALVFKAGENMLRLVKVPDFEPFPFTILGWQVADIEKTAATLRKNKVKFQKYPFMEQDANSIWTAPGGARIAWFKDPDGNVLSISQH